MESLTGFIIYALLFRLFIIAAGVVAIVLGYKLFVQGIVDNEKSCVRAQACSIGLTLYNAAPGSVFALFGAFVIIVMLIQGNPELLVEEVGKGSASSYEPSGMRIQLKGGQGDEEGNETHISETNNSFQQVFNRGKQQHRFKNSAEAENLYYQALSISQVSLYQAAKVFNELAWMYRGQGRIDEAIAMARVATSSDDMNPAYFDTLALALLDKGEPELALKAAEASVAIDPDNEDHNETLRQVRSALRFE